MNQNLSCVLGAGLETRSLPEIAILVIPPGPRVKPIRHEKIAHAVMDYIWSQKGDLLVQASHAINPTGTHYLGLFDVKTQSARDFRWLIAATNGTDGTAVFNLHSGIVIPDAEMSFVFHHTDIMIRRGNNLDDDELQALVNETLLRMRDHYNLCFERMDHLKSCKLTNQAACELICAILGVEVIAGRSAHEFINAWKKPPFAYMKPRTMWSLYCLCAWFLKRLRAHVLIERTQNLNHFFDDMAKFDKKPTRWVQDAFA